MYFVMSVNVSRTNEGAALISAEEFARSIYAYKRALAALFSDCGEIQREEWSWANASREEKRLMIASAQLALSEDSNSIVPTTTTASWEQSVNLD
jgi:hypothetical protein